jgi:sugar phosphate isomerase/epimerase
MKFAINYSTQAAVLFTQGRLMVDRFKCPDWPDLISEASQYGQVAVHFDLSAGRGMLELKDLDRAGRIAEQTQTPYINLHLEAKNSDFKEFSPHPITNRLREKVLQRTIEEVEMAVRRFGSENVIVENVPYRTTGNLLPVCVEPEFINKIVQETSCGLLLDLPHARITANNLGVDERDYILSLPHKMIRELHFTGVHDLGNRLQDHLPALDQDWELLEWALINIRNGNWSRAWMLAFEYGGVGEKFNWRSSAQTIEEQGKQLYTLVNPI